VNNKLGVDGMKWEMVLANFKCNVCIFLERRFFVYILCFPYQGKVPTDPIYTERNSLESIINIGETFRFNRVTTAVEDTLKPK